jgi:hypothetical protein
VIWESAALPKPVQLSMALYDGILYGVTSRDSTLLVNYVFAIRASDGAILYTTPISTSADMTWRNVTLVPNVFGPGEHGLYWNHDRTSPDGTDQARIHGVKVSTTAATQMWVNSPIRTAVSYIMYNAAKNVLYAMHWGDYGSTVESYDPVTGVKKWVARNTEFGSSFNGGFYGTHALKPDGSGFIFAGFSGDVRSISDPGDLAGGNLPATNLDWIYDGNDYLGESQTLAALVKDTAGNQVFLCGTTANSANSVKRRLYIQDSIGGGRLQEWLNPVDAGAFNTAYNFRCLSVGPDGTIYYLDAQEGTNGTLYALQTRSFVPPTLAAVTSPDTGFKLTEYICQLQVTGGDPAGHWTKVDGPEGLKVSNTGRVYGWSPKVDDVGKTFNISVSAANPGGATVVSWAVKVIDPLQFLTLSTAHAPVVSTHGNSLASDGAGRLYYFSNTNAELRVTTDEGQTWSSLASAPLNQSSNDDDGALAFAAGQLITRRNDGTNNLLVTYDPATDTWTQRGARYFGGTGYTVIGNTLYGNSHAAAVNQGGPTTIIDLNNLDAVSCERAAWTGLAGADTTWMSRAVQMAAGPVDGWLYGIKNDWTTPNGTGDRLWKVNPASIVRNQYIGPNWDSWTHNNTPATDLGKLPWEIGYGSAVCAVPPGWAGISYIGAQGGLFIVAGQSPSNNEGWGDPSNYFAIYDIATGRYMQGSLPDLTGNGTAIAFHNGRVFIKQGGNPDYTDVIWIYGPYVVPAPSADLDHDGDVDNEDFNRFEACVTGPTMTYDPASLPAPAPGCELVPDPFGYIQADFDRDGIIDMEDFARFQRCYSTNGPTLVGCMD